MLVSAVSVNDGHVVDDRRIFQCNEVDHAFWCQLRDLAVQAFSDFDYTKSARFQARIEGKSSQFIRVVTNMAKLHETEYLKELMNEMQSMTMSDRIYDLLPTHLHEQFRLSIQSLRKLRG